MDTAFGDTGSRMVHHLIFGKSALDSSIVPLVWAKVRYVRYADDWLLFSDDKAQLHEWRTRIGGFLGGLRLVLHDRKTQVYPVDTGIPFLGFRLYPDYRRLKRPSIIRFKRRMRRLFHRFADGEVRLDRVQSSIDGWVAHARHGSTYRLREQLLSGLVVPRPGAR